MQEFMLLIRNEGGAKAQLSAEKHHAFIKECESYISELKAENKLIAAQPLAREGVVISPASSGWNERSLGEDGDVQVGYYHIMAADINEAINIAKQNPEFEYVPTASIEVRPIKTKEQETGFVYPK